ncbi:glycosyltransferase domain-containing protein [Chlorobaculum sp. 24CR]|uniref:glycosyltransferase domain-containing protein n=1 Tax=Chlorobaculum sp. 24CR TaxID=2508878 RepID=UPI0014320E68|nr:glycosyltransferase domain-containing protein [Chlorobaculum sp. 24CR]
MNSKIVVYTALFGEYDDLKTPPEPIDGCDFVCFTNNRKLISGTFDIRYLDLKGMDNTRRNRMVKLLPHRFFPDHEYSIYIDGSVSIKRTDIRDFALSHLVKHNWAAFSHSSRNCIYEELEACIERQKDDPVTMRRQIKHYRRMGHPEKYGLTENTIFFAAITSPTSFDFLNSGGRSCNGTANATS